MLRKPSTWAGLFAAVLIACAIGAVGYLAGEAEAQDRSPFFGRHQPGGMFSIVNEAQHPGNVWFVDSEHTGASDAAGFGKQPDAPFDQIEYAVGQATASNGDVIYVMPGHLESVAGAAELDVDKAGIKIVGLGWGDTRPKVQLSAQASTVEFNADDMWIENIIFEGTYTNGVTVGLDIKTGCDDLTFKNCLFRATASTKELLTAITIEATNDRITFDSCEWFEYVGGDAASAIITEGAFTNLRIIGCKLYGDWDVAVFDMDATAVTTEGLYIYDLICFNSDQDTGLLLTTDNTTVAFLVGIRFGMGKADTPPYAAADDGAASVVDCMGTEGASTAAGLADETGGWIAGAHSDYDT